MTIRFGNAATPSTYVQPSSPAIQQSLLGLGTMAIQNSSAVAITGGSIAGASLNSSSVDLWGGKINGVVLGATLASSASFTGVSLSSNLDAVRIAASSGISASSAAFTSLVATTLVDFSAAGAGQIKFPAAQNASADANTLDDYEEGMWTPAQGAGLTVFGAFTSSGMYVKVGQLVKLHGVVNGAVSVAVAANGLITNNLPFTTKTASSIATGTALNAAGTVTSVVYAGSGGTNLAATTAIAATTNIFFSISYIASA